MIASGSSDGTVRLWWAASGAERTVMTIAGREVASVVWSPDGRTLASGLSDGTVRLWDELGTPRGALAEHAQAITSVAWSPDGATLASGSYDGTLRLWDVGARTCIAILLPQPYGWAAYTLDGRYKLSGDIAGAFWHAIGLCRFEPGEIDPYLRAPLRVPDGAPLFTLPSARLRVAAPPPRPTEPIARAPKPTLTILFLAANPSDTTRRALDREVREIQQRLSATAYRDKIHLVQAWAVRPDGLQECLLRHKPDVIHWSGHGNAVGQLLLEDEGGRAFAVGKSSLTELFRLFRRDVRCVVLSACYSADQAREIAAHIDCVVGMTAALPDDAASTFAGAFYQGIGFGRSVADAFALGCNAIDLKALPAKDVPQLLSRGGVDPEQVRLVASKDGSPEREPG